LIRFNLHIAFLLVSCFAFGQNLTQTEKYWLEDRKTLHSSYQNEFNFFPDTIFKNEGKFKYSFAPSILVGTNGTNLKTNSGVQFIGYRKFSDKLNLKIYNELGYSNGKLTPYESVLQSKSFFYFPIKNDHAVFNDLRGRLSYVPNKHFELQTGVDKHFFGEGSRSLLMGNQGVSSPFVMMKAKIWKLEYISLHQIWRENQPGHYLPKASATHYINFNHKNKISFGIFESVVHIIKDTLYNRGFEVEYLNPMIFYRPQEYSVGSSDNVLLGLNGFITMKKSILYGQVILDDINIAEIKARSKWWANKYGLMAGFKRWFTISQKQVFFRSELSFTTPYTYAAANNNLNYSNQGLGLAHPLGGNFAEWYNEVSFDLKSWNIHAWGQFYLKGNDPANTEISYGGDIYKSYIKRPFGDYGYSMFIGEKTYRLQIGTKISKLVASKNWTIFAEPRLFLTKRTPEIVPTFYFTAGIHYNILADKRNY
jgi:hypothetical protein